MINKKLPLNIYAGDQFVWKGHRGCTCASSLNAGIGLTAFVSPIWENQFEVGFVVQSHRTQVKKLFILASSDDDSWVFKSRDGKQLITVFND